MAFQYPTAEEIKQKLLEIIRLQQESGRPALLSYVGLQLAKYFRRPFRQMSLEPNLASFIRRYMSDEVELHTSSSHDLVLFATLRPVGSNSSTPNFQSDDSDPTRKAEHALKTIKSTPMYDSSFWAAFAKPLASNAVRYLRSEKPFLFVDLPLDSPPPEGYLIIDDNFVAPSALSSGPARSEFVAKQIDAWLEKNELAPDRYIRPKRDTAPTEDRTLPIIEILARLEQRDLERLMIPADVWLKLNGVRG